MNNIRLSLFTVILVGCASSGGDSRPHPVGGPASNVVVQSEVYTGFEGLPERPKSHMVLVFLSKDPDPRCPFEDIGSIRVKYKQEIISTFATSPERSEREYADAERAMGQRLAMRVREMGGDAVARLSRSFVLSDDPAAGMRPEWSGVVIRFTDANCKP